MRPASSRLTIRLTSSSTKHRFLLLGAVCGVLLLVTCSRRTRPLPEGSRSLVHLAPVASSAYLERLRAAAATPITVAVMGRLFWDPDPAALQGCALDGVPLTCRLLMPARKGVPHPKAVLDAADAHLYHLPVWGARPLPKAFRAQLRIGLSLESAAYYEVLDEYSRMCEFDAEMSYRTCAQVVNYYTLDIVGQLFQAPPVPFEDKLHALVYLNKNCDTLSGRERIMQRLMALGARAHVAVHSFGSCDRNMDPPEEDPGKVELFSRYKFCVAMENSVSHDYVTEKLWQALQAGCVPVYLGSPTARQLVPDPRSIIVYDPAGAGDASTPAQLDALLHAIGSDRGRYEAMLAWKHVRPEAQPSLAFRQLWQQRNVSGECELCRFLAHHRMQPQPRYNTCLFNETWMSAAGQDWAAEEEACPSLHPEFFQQQQQQRL